ncbi:MAG TPA: 50S ribosomal protein L18 [Patescibacteria group bacterium]|nr:50S ribosomal protein L18 [Patescibacteria group bacterium]
MEEKDLRARRRQLRVRGKIGGKAYRLSVSRSNRYLFAQIIDLKSGQTVLGLSDKKLMMKAESRAKTDRAREFGEQFAQEALKRKVKEIVFDRRAYRYHGRIKSFAEGLRQGGLIF